MNKWTPEKDTILEARWRNKYKVSEIARDTDMTENQVRHRRRQLDLPSRVVGGVGSWTPEKDGVLKSMWEAGAHQDDIAKELKTTAPAICRRRFILGLPKRKLLNKESEFSLFFTDEKDDELKECVANGLSTIATASQIGCSYWWAYYRANQLGVRWTS